MDVQEYAIQKTDLYSTLLLFLENQTNESELFPKLKFQENRDDLREFLHLLSYISKNHFRYPGTIDKIEKILNLLKDNIKQTFSNSEIFNFFKNSKRILFFLFETKIITPSKFIVNTFLDKNMKDKNYHLYFHKIIDTFLTEDEKETIKSELSKLDKNTLQNFESKCKIGENESYLCSLIRNDLIDDFVIHTNQTNLKLTSQINSSIYETNSFLLKNPKTSLIEYAAFFGSIQIFQFLKLNNVELKPSLWLYAIHGRNHELIHLLEECHVKPDDSTFKQCYNEAVKCHHNEIANYISDNFLKADSFFCGLHNHNYEFFPNNISNDLIFSYLCKYDYVPLVKLLFKKDELKMKEKIINEINCLLSNLFFVLMTFSISMLNTVSLFYFGLNTVFFLISFFK
ncbi:hypothetical protein M9Y10_037088 [Tritrichomonas musculus]|uniref:DUF3447 domain-containing protein n=1 Tax=Tritrichomonas musculus TaxID=1915356 RepID=A0ABR2GU06_9EUKA